MRRCMLLATASLVLIPVLAQADADPTKPPVAAPLYNNQRMCDNGNQAACDRVSGTRQNAEAPPPSRPNEQAGPIITPRPWWSDSFARMRGNNAEPNQN